MFDHQNAKNQTSALEGRKVNSARVGYLAENDFADKGSAQTELTGPLNTKHQSRIFPAGKLNPVTLWGLAPGRMSYRFNSGQNLALR